jgi:hypothetical protein
MHDLQMTTSKTIDSYYGRMEDILLQLPLGHGFNDEMKKSIFIKSLIPFRLKAYVKEIEPATLEAAYQRAKLYENIYTANDDALVLSYINSTQVKANQNLPVSNPVTYPPQVGLPSTIKISMVPAYYMLPVDPPIGNAQGGNQLVHDGGGGGNDVLFFKMEDLAQQMGELGVHAANASNQRKQPVDDRAHIWCTNCKGQGHLKLDCPSLPALPPKCRFYGGNHGVVSYKLIINPGQVKNGRQNQVYQVENDSNGNYYYYYYQNRGNNRNNNQGNNWNRRPRYKNNNFNSFAPPGNLQSNFNPNNFNNGGYRSNPSHFMPQNPTNQNQGWSQMPYGNPN